MMERVDTHGSFEEAIAGASEEVQGVARALRALIVEVYPAVVEVAWPRQGTVGYGVGPKKMSEQFCYIAVHGAHANLGFYYGATLPDGEGLLEGTGKKLRHVKVREAAETERPALRALVAAALAERKEARGME